MPNQEIAFLNQQALLWTRQGTDSFGQPTVSGPTQIPVRWNTTRKEALDPNGNTVTLDAVVIVNQKIAVGSWMWLGTLGDWQGTGSGSADVDEEMMEVISISETPDIKNRVTFRQLGLMRLHQKGAG